MAKYLSNNAGQITEVAASVTSSGAASAGVIPAADATGRIDASFLPAGIGADTQVVTTSEAIAAGAYVNIYNNGGAFALRNADNTVAGKEAHGFCLTAFASGVPATVYFNGNNTAVTAQSPGRVYLGTVGGTLAAAPAGTGKVVQLLGMAPSASVNNFTYTPSIVLA